MPKGAVTERDATCRACGTVFRSTACGKAAFYCRTAACDEERARNHFTVENTGSAEIKAEREHRKAERQRQREEEREQREAEKDAAKRLRRVERQEERERRQFALEAERLRGQVERAKPGLEKALADARRRRDDINAMLDRIGVLEGRPRVREVPAVALAQTLESQPDVVPIAVATGEVGDALAEIRHAVVTRPRQPEPSREAVVRAVRRLAYAEGLPATHGALSDLIVEALAWNLMLGTRVVRENLEAA